MEIIFKEQLTNYQTTINEYLKQYMTIHEGPEKVLNEAVSYSLLAGGKRLRPILLLATYQLFYQDVTPCIPFAVALEMIHNFSLIHDDLPAIDNDEIRHGKPSNHAKFGESTAILAGDRLLNSAYTVILQEMKNTPQYIEAFQILNEATNQMIAGEFIDVDCENKNIDLTLLQYMHDHKTGALINAAVKIGAMMGNASSQDLSNLELYSKSIGLAFQIKDDILSEIGDPVKLGKPVGNDKKLHKCTFVSIYGIEKSQELLNQLIRQSIHALDSYPNATFLQELAVYIKDREK